MILTSTALFLFSGLFVSLPQDPILEVEIPEGVTTEDGEYLELRFDETGSEGLTIRQFIKICQVNTGRNFTVDKQNTSVEGKLAETLVLYGRKRIRRDEFYSFFQSMLKFHGLVCVEQGEGDLSIVLITVAMQGGNKANPLVSQNTMLIPLDEVSDYANQPGTFISTLYPLKHLDAASVVTALGSILNADGKSITAMSNTRAVMISDYGPMVAASVRFLEHIDVEPDTPKPMFRKIQLQEASAEDMAELLEKILEDLEDPASATGASRSVGGRSRADTPRNSPTAVIRTSIIANARDNSLIVTATPDNMERLLDLIAELDSRIVNPVSNLHVYPLQYLNAKSLADDTLKDFLRQSAEASQSGRGGSSENVIGTNEQKVTVVAQESTNSLLITATRTKWAEIKGLLDLLDVEQPQVLIATALVEVSEDFSKDIGFEFASARQPDSQGEIRGSVSTNTGLTSADGAGDRVMDIFQSGLTAGILEGDGDGGFGIPLMLRMAQSRGNAQILSKPSVLVDNNQVAYITSVDSIPFGTNTVTGTGVSQGSVEYKEAGITLEISPSISASGFLRLGISLEVSSFRSSSDPDLPPPTTSRTIKTVVHMPDGATMWIGGIVRDDYLDSQSGVPYLSALPLVGWLFSRDDDSSTKTTLFFFCTPKIIDTAAELVDISEATKAIAADVVGLDRMQIVDPGYQPDVLPDVILEDGTEVQLVPTYVPEPVEHISGMDDPSELSAPSVPATSITRSVTRELPDIPQ